MASEEAATGVTKAPPDFNEDSPESSDDDETLKTESTLKLQRKRRNRVTPATSATSHRQPLTCQPPRRRRTPPPALRIADDDLVTDCYVIPATAAASDAESWRLVEAMQSYWPDKFEDCLRILLHSMEEKESLVAGDSTSVTASSHEQRNKKLSVHSLRVEYDNGSTWSSSDMDFHYVAHLCAFYAASGCFHRLVQLATSSGMSQSEVATAASRVFGLSDKNGCSLLHAVCWGCYHQVKPTAAYAAFLQAALESGGAAVTRATAKRVDDFDFNSLELAIYLECYHLAGIFLELPGVYVQSSVHGNLVTKHYLLDEYIVGSHRNRYHRAPMTLLASLSTPEQISRLQQSGFLQHPALLCMGISFSVKIVLAFELLPWIVCLCMLYIPLPFSYGFFHESAAAADPLAVVKCSPASSPPMSVPIHAGVMLAKEDIEKRIRYALGLSSDKLDALVADMRNNFCKETGPQFEMKLSDWHHIVQFVGLFIALLILIKAMLLPLRALVSIAINHCKLKWRSVRYRHLYHKRTQSTDLLLFLCLFCWISYWLFAALFNCCLTQPCSLGPVQFSVCHLVSDIDANYTSLDAIASIKQTIQNFEAVSQAVGCFLHLCALCVNLLFLYMMESAPVFGETVMMFRQVLERFMQLSLIYIICIVIFANLFWAQTAGILHQVGADLGQFGSMDLASFLGEFYRIFSTSLNLFDPTTRKFGNSTLTMELKKTEIQVLHFVYILTFAILTLNFLIAALVSFIDRIAQSKSTMHFLHRLHRANRVRYGLWHKVWRLCRLISCNRRKRTLQVRSTVSDRNRASWVDLNLPPTEATKLGTMKATLPAATEEDSAAAFAVVDIDKEQQGATGDELVALEEGKSAEVTTVVAGRCKTAGPLGRSDDVGDHSRSRKTSF